jgi:hypothetical protein
MSCDGVRNTHRFLPGTAALGPRETMYYYETLGDERFQQLCQALIALSFPNTQCLPVGQPDDGRDAFLFEHLISHSKLKPPRRELLVFQVKYVRNSTDTRTDLEMIEEVVKGEKKKILKLKELGLSKYCLLTNLKGTAHLGSGSIDRINNTLSDSLGMEAYCWWRDDIDRRIDGSSSIKWSYPEILRATDLLQTLVSGLLGKKKSVDATRSAHTSTRNLTTIKS